MLLRSSVVVLLILWSFRIVAAQSRYESQPTELRSSSEHPLPLGDFTYSGAAQCDADGNLYYRPDADLKDYRNTNGLLRIDPIKGTTTTFILPPDLRHEDSFISHSVTRSGRVWVLLQQGAGDYLAVNWNSDGNIEHRIKLAVPSQVFANWFVVADDGIFLLGGLYPDDDPRQELRGQPFFGVFDQNGNVRNTIPAKSLDKISSSNGVLAMTDIAAAS